VNLWNRPGRVDDPKTLWKLRGAAQVLLPGRVKEIRLFAFELVEMA